MPLRPRVRERREWVAISAFEVCGSSLDARSRIPGRPPVVEFCGSSATRAADLNGGDLGYALSPRGQCWLRVYKLPIGIISPYWVLRALPREAIFCRMLPRPRGAKTTICPRQNRKYPTCPRFSPRFSFAPVPDFPPDFPDFPFALRGPGPRERSRRQVVGGIGVNASRQIRDLLPTTYQSSPSAKTRFAPQHRVHLIANQWTFIKISGASS
jgi:hypothetical protein